MLKLVIEAASLTALIAAVDSASAELKQGSNTVIAPDAVGKTMFAKNNPPAAPQFPSVPSNGITQPAATPTAPVVDEDEEDDTPNVAGVIDKNGLPWDERIHSSNRKQSGKGVWVKRKGVDDATFNAVVSELRARGVGNSPAPQFNQFPTQPVQGIAPSFPVPPMPNFQPQQPAPAPQFSIPQQPVQAATINDLFNKIQQLFKNGQADNEYLLSLTNRLSQGFNVQLNGINDIANRPDMIAQAFALIAQDGK